MTNNKLYARDEYLKKKAADSNGLNIQLTNNYAFRKTFKKYLHSKRIFDGVIRIEGG